MGHTTCDKLHPHILHGAILLGLLLLCGCTAGMHGYERRSYTNLGWLRVDPTETAPKTGYKRLQNEIAFCKAVKTHVAQEGLPDYLFVPAFRKLYLAYTSRGKVYEFRTSPSGRLLATHDWSAFQGLPTDIRSEFAKRVESQLSTATLVPEEKGTGTVKAPEQNELTQTPVSLAPMKQELSLPPAPVSDTAVRWALVIGVSRYQDTRIPQLRYAGSDARSFHDWLISPTGGRYAPDRVRLLVDEQATAKAMRSALFVWLKQAIEEDMVTVFFAGHGSPESPDYPNNLFLLPYDAQYDDLPSTGFPMWDVETALNRYIKAKKVVVIADACHSGGVGQSFDIARHANRGIKVNPISTGLQGLSKVGDGVCVISASDEKQFSREGKDWGGGHGVFTHFLLKGLRGNADYNKDTSVTLGELTLYLSQEVRRATKNAQSPTVAGRYDPALTIGK